MKKLITIALAVALLTACEKTELTEQVASAAEEKTLVSETPALVDYLQNGGEIKNVSTLFPERNRSVDVLQSICNTCDVPDGYYFYADKSNPSTISLVYVLAYDADGNYSHSDWLTADVGQSFTAVLHSAYTYRIVETSNDSPEFTTIRTGWDDDRYTPSLNIGVGDSSFSAQWMFTPPNPNRFRYDVTLDTSLGLTGWRGILILNDTSIIVATSAEVTSSVTSWFTPTNTEAASFRVEFLRNGRVIGTETVQRPAVSASSSTAYITPRVDDRGYILWNFGATLDASMGVTGWRITFSKQGAQSHVSTFTSSGGYTDWNNDYRHARIDYLRGDALISSAPVVSAPLTWRTAETGDQVNVRIPGENADARFRYDGSSWVGQGTTPASRGFFVSIRDIDDTKHVGASVQDYYHNSAASLPAGGNPFWAKGLTLNDVFLLSETVPNIIRGLSIRYQFVDARRGVWRQNRAGSNANRMQLRSPNYAIDLAILFPNAAGFLNNSFDAIHYNFFNSFQGGESRAQVIASGYPGTPGGAINRVILDTSRVPNPIFN